MNKWQFIWVLMLVGFSFSLDAGESQRDGPWDFAPQPELAQSLPLIGVDVAHRLGATGKGVSVIVIDNFTRNPKDPCNDLVHGKWVAGVLEAVAPQARIYRIDVPLDVPGTGDGACYGFSSGVLIEALREAFEMQREQNIRVINYSIGGGRFEHPCAEVGPMADLIRQLVSQGVMFVTAAGNNGFTDALGFPECMPETISVGSVYDYSAGELEQATVCADFPQVDKVACYSNSAFFLDVLAPGSWITVSNDLNSIGTSAAAPHVAGVIALLLQINPALDLSDIRSILRRTGKSISDQRNGLTFPRVDAQSAVTLLLALINHPPIVDIFFSPAEPTPLDTVTFGTVVTDQDGDPLTFTWFQDDQLQPAARNAAARWENPPVGVHTVTVRVDDGRGGIGEDTVQLEVKAARSATERLANALDIDKDRLLGDEEILEAVRLWITAQRVPGSDWLVDDDAVFQLIELWIAGRPFESIDNEGRAG